MDNNDDNDYTQDLIQYKSKILTMNYVLYEDGSRRYLSYEEALTHLKRNEEHYSREFLISWGVIPTRRKRTKGYWLRFGGAIILLGIGLTLSYYTIK